MENCNHEYINHTDLGEICYLCGNHKYSIYKELKDHPKNIKISNFWNNGGQVSTLREALPYDHPENLWNWFVKKYPDLNPNYYDILKPKKNN